MEGESKCPWFSSHTWIYWILQDFDDLDVNFWNNRAGWWPRHQRGACGNLSDSVFNSFRLVTWLNNVKSSSSNFSWVSKPIYIHIIYIHYYPLFTSIYIRLRNWKGQPFPGGDGLDCPGVFYSLAKHEAAQRATRATSRDRHGAVHQRRLGRTAW